MDFGKKMKMWLRSALLNLGKVDTDKGPLFWDGDQILRVSDAVYREERKGEDDDPDYVPVEDGEYKAKDGRVIVVKDGVVVEIKEGKEPQPDGAPAPVKQDVQDPAPDPAPEHTPDDKADKEEVAKLEKRIDDLEKLCEDLKKRVEELGAQPADDPADAKDGEKDVKQARVEALAKIRRNN